MSKSNKNTNINDAFQYLSNNNDDDDNNNKKYKTNNNNNNNNNNSFFNSTIFKVCCLCTTFIIIILFIISILYVLLSHAMQDSNNSQLLKNHLMIDNKKVLEFDIKECSGNLCIYYFDFKTSTIVDQQELYLLNFENDLNLNKIMSENLCCVSRESKNQCTNSFFREDDDYFHGYLTQDENGQILLYFWFNNIIYSQIDCWLKCEVGIKP